MCLSKSIRVIAVIAISATLASKAAAQQIPALVEVLPDIARIRSDLVDRRSELLQQRVALHKRFQQHKVNCSSVVAGSSQDTTCMAARSELAGGLARHIADSNAFNRAVEAAEATLKALQPIFQPSGNALVGGTRWLFGYNVQSTDPALLARAQSILAKQLHLAGLDDVYGAIDFNRYNFVIGIAASTSIMDDLRRRVWRDHISNGDFSRENQPLYASLKGRQFNELGCHSNGAMVCLAAIENNDVKADHVVLYGPELTHQSLRLWNDLLARGEIKSLDLYVNQNDPIPPLSLAFGPMSPADFAEYASRALFKSAIMSLSISDLAPQIVVHTSACSGELLSTTCHDMSRYRAAAK